MKLTTRSRYGTRMILDIALNGALGPVRLADVAKRQGISLKYLEKLVRELKRAGFVASRRGPGGGHVLARRAEDISIGAVVRLLEGDEPLAPCGRGGQSCPRRRDCPTRQVWDSASESLYERLDRLSLADLARDAGKCGLSEGKAPD